jgi:hypothetical protein
MAANYTLVFPSATSREAAATERIRLIPAKDGHLVFLSETRAARGFGYETAVLSRGPGDGPRELQFKVQQILAVPSTWDVAQQGGAYLLAVTIARGGNNGLTVVSPDGRQIPLRPARSADDLSRPRFVRHLKPDTDARISAIMAHGEVVVFDLSGKYTTVAPAIAAVIVESAGGFSLIGKERIPGPVRGQDISPGKLLLTKLDAQFKAVGKPQPLLHGATIFEFDAVPVPQGVALFATTGPGLSAIVFDSGKDTEPPVELQVVSRQPMISPSILMSGGSIHLAALTGAGSADAALRIGELKS